MRRADCEIFRIAGIGLHRFTVTELASGDFEVRVIDAANERDFKAVV